MNQHRINENPWQTQTRHLAYENAWIEVRHHEVVRPDGASGIYGVVHFKNRAIGILPIDENGWTYLVGQYRYPLDVYSWEIPEGGGPLDEDPLAAAQRELQEETGLTATQWELLGTAHLSNSVSDEVALFYVATGLHQGVAIPEGTEQLRIWHLPFAEAYALACRGEITDALSLLAIFRYALRLRG